MRSDLAHPNLRRIFSQAILFSRSNRQALVLAALAGLSCIPKPQSVGHAGFVPRVTADLGCRSGLRVIYEATPASNVATVMLYINAGSREDPVGREGLAHLVEHLVLRASSVRQAKSGTLTLMGVEDKATTDHDSVNFDASGPASSVEVMLKEQAAKLSNPLGGVTVPVFEVDRNVVRNELRRDYETDLKGHVVDWHWETMFPPPHPYQREVLGTHDSLAAISLAEARKWAAAYYRPDRATMVVTGALGTRELESLVEELPREACGGLLRPFKPARRTPNTFAEAPDSGPIGLVRRTGDVVAPELWVGWRVPGILDPSYPVADVWVELLKNNLTVAKLGDTDVTAISCGPLEGELGSVIGCRLGLASTEHAEATATRLKGALPSLAANLAAGLPRTKRAVKLREAYLAETPWVRAQSRGFLAHVGGVYDPATYDPQTRQAVAAETLQAFQQKYLTPELGGATLVEPSHDEGSTPPRLPAHTRAAAPGLDWKTYATSVLDELAEIRFLGDLWTTTLPNGLELVVLPRRRAPVVTSVLGFHVGRDDQVASIAAEAAMKTILDPAPPDSGLILGSSFAERYVTMWAKGGSEDLADEIATLARAARRYDVEWPSAKFQYETLPRLRELDATPLTKTYREMAAELFGAHPLSRPVRAEDAEALSKKQLVDFLRRTISPQNAILVVVGDVGPEQVLEAVQREFMDWAPSARSRTESLPPLHPRSYPPTPAGRLVPPAVVPRPGASQAQLYLGCLLPLTDPAIDAKYDVAADVLVDQMTFDMRDTLGATYEVEGGAHSVEGGTAYLWMSAAIENHEVSTALQRMREFWGFVAHGRWTFDSVRQNQITRLRGWVFDFESSSLAAAHIVGTWLMNWPLASIDERASHIRNLRKSDVDSVLRACAEQLVVTVSGDPAVIRSALAK